MPRFSIIIPVYNVRDYVGVTLKSVLEQTHPDFEVIAIDDGSTDDSGLILDEIARGDSRVRVLRQANAGVSAARNCGLDHAMGDWIVFVDGDDALRLDALEILENVIDRHPDVDLIGYGFDKVADISKESLRGSERRDNIRVSVSDSKECACFNALNHYMVWTEAVRRDLATGIRFLPLKNGEDVLFCNSVGIRANCYASLHVNLYLYLQREASARSNEWTERRHSDYDVLNAGILKNLVESHKTIDNAWLKRWVGTLLQYKPEAWILDRKIQNRHFNVHYDLMRMVIQQPLMPAYLRLWLRIATAVKWKEYFKIMAMLPMRIYSR